MSERVLALVACGDQKRAYPTPAANLYTSTYFRKKREWAESCDFWRILSAEHGLVQPASVLTPYDTRIGDFDDEEVANWAEAVWSELSKLVEDVEIVVVLAGSDYFNPLESELTDAGARVVWPFEGKRIGEQIAWMKHNPPPDQSTFEAFG